MYSFKLYFVLFKLAPFSQTVISLKLFAMNNGIIGFNLYELEKGYNKTFLIIITQFKSKQDHF
jgi:hypothetical protein